MQTTSPHGRIQLSPSSASLLQACLPADLALVPRGEPFEVKGKVRGAYAGTGKRVCVSMSCRMTASQLQ